ncbi:MAG: PAS domain S-box protein, partial [Actinomycetota bacterium]
MESVPADWSVQQLTEFSSFVSGFVEETAAARAAVERACEALEAEVGALVVDGTVGPAMGFPAGRVPAEDLLDVVRGVRAAVDVPGAGPCPVLAVPLEDGIEGHIVLARSGCDGFSQEETTLLRGMARILALSINRLRVLEALRVSEARARRVIETAGESFVAVGLSGRVRDWNQQAELTFGFSAEEALGMPARALFAPDAATDAEEIWEELRNSLDGTPVRRETWALHRDGRRFPVEITSWSFAGSGSRVFNAFVKDITGRKRARELENRLAAI